MTQHTGAIGLAAAAIADAAFPHFLDRDRRNKLALALVDFAETIIARVAAGPAGEAPESLLKD